MECASLRGEEYVTSMWQFVAPQLLEAVPMEPDKDVLSMVMEALAKVGHAQCISEDCIMIWSIIQTSFSSALNYVGTVVSRWNSIKNLQQR